MAGISGLLRVPGRSRMLSVLEESSVCHCFEVISINEVLSNAQQFTKPQCKLYNSIAVTALTELKMEAWLIRASLARHW